MDPILIPCLVQLRTEFNTLSPGRSKESDGWIGDTAHQHEVSDHNPDETGSVPIHDADHINEVHAVDVTAPITGVDIQCPAGGTAYYPGMEGVVQFLLARCRSGAEKRLRYIIYNRRIWEASNGWKQRAYKGPSAHTEHAHFSASYESALEASTASWHLEDIPVALTQDDKNWITDQLHAVVKAEIADVLSVDVKFTDKLGGASSQLAQAVFNAGFPATPGAPRTPLWQNLAELRAAVDATKSTGK